MKEIKKSGAQGDVMFMPTPCRCGWDGRGDHPCHGNAYWCRKPAKLRFYRLQASGLSGMQMKLTCDSTWACDKCWDTWIEANQGQQCLVAGEINEPR